LKYQSTLAIKSLRSSRTMRGVISVIAITFLIMLSAQVVSADVIIHTDYDLLRGSVGTVVSAPLSPPDSLHLDAFTGLPTGGSIQTTVYYNDANSLFTYEIVMRPGLPNLTEWNTGFNEPYGFNGIAGHSYSEALAVAEPSYTGDGSDIFKLTQQTASDNSLDWNVDKANVAGLDNYWIGEYVIGAPSPTPVTDPVTFFFQSTHGPGQALATTVQSTAADPAKGFFGGSYGSTQFPSEQAAPIPVPSSLIILLSGLLGIACARKRIHSW